ncbi:hypothetical protein PIB30_058882 [Stylosanthes scabra]|uniref:Pectin acetylesterase n=1 Tax=Stylosanthes scabra TaxID=79078 RepID=A0ABU6WL92_9FABA|nr:hypothetical protein [Stylosanthes scabra]
MGKLFWLAIAIPLVLTNCVAAFQWYQYEYHHFNETQLSLLEADESLFQSNTLFVGLNLIHTAAAKGVVCLDGTFPAYHFHRGYGSGANTWLRNLEVSSL